jgi:hypothetical protein
MQEHTTDCTVTIEKQQAPLALAKVTIAPTNHTPPDPRGENRNAHLCGDFDSLLTYSACRYPCPINTWGVGFAAPKAAIAPTNHTPPDPRGENRNAHVYGDFDSLLTYSACRFPCPINTSGVGLAVAHPVVHFHHVTNSEFQHGPREGFNTSRDVSSRKYDVCN